MEKSYLIPCRMDRDYFCITPINGSTTISWDWRYEGQTDQQIDLEYSYNTANWTKYTLGTNITTSDPIYWRGNNKTGFAKTTALHPNNLCHLVLNNTCDLSGRLSTLTHKFISASPHTCPNLLLADKSIFADNTYIHSVKDLILDYIVEAAHVADVEDQKCYAHLFEGCTSLIDTPVFGAAMRNSPELACASMFYGCTSLTTVYDLLEPKGTGCYTWAFWGCTSLQKPPKLPFTNLTAGCYQYMFQGCTNLTELPRLPATILPRGCYLGMFLQDGDNYMISTTQDSTYQYEFRIPISGTATYDSQATYPTEKMFASSGHADTINRKPELNTTYYCKLPTASE